MNAGFIYTELTRQVCTTQETEYSIVNVSDYSAVLFVVRNDSSNSFNIPCFCPLSLFKLGKYLTAANPIADYQAQIKYLTDTRISLVGTAEKACSLYGLKF